LGRYYAAPDNRKKQNSMTVSYFVRYRGHARDPRAFVEYYRKSHAPLLWRFPGIRDLILHLPVDFDDPFPVTPGGELMVAQMVFDTLDDLNRALASEARARAREDFANMPEFSGEISHQAMRTETVAP
jgi:uncharacterized protein (TIGR02118 family)